MVFKLGNSGRSARVCTRSSFMDGFLRKYSSEMSTRASTGEPLSDMMVLVFELVEIMVLVIKVDLPFSAGRTGVRYVMFAGLLLWSTEPASKSGLVDIELDDDRDEGASPKLLAVALEWLRLNAEVEIDSFLGFWSVLFEWIDVGDEFDRILDAWLLKIKGTGCACGVCCCAAGCSDCDSLLGHILLKNPGFAQLKSSCAQYASPVEPSDAVDVSEPLRENSESLPDEILLEMRVMENRLDSSTMVAPNVSGSAPPAAGFALCALRGKLSALASGSNSVSWACCAPGTVSLGILC